MAKFRFRALLYDAGNGFVCLDLPREVSAKLPRGRAPVAGVLNTFPIRTSVFPTGNGSHMMLVNKAMQKGAAVAVGDTVMLRLEVDTEPRQVTLSPDVKKALAASTAARSAFEAMPYSHQKEYLEYIDEARRPETRARRIAKTVETLAQKK